MKFTFEIDTNKPNITGVINVESNLERAEDESNEEVAAFLYMLTNGLINEQVVMGLGKNVPKNEMKEILVSWDAFVNLKKDYSENFPIIPATQTKL